jgi:antitoxin component HigA of HigAB toxin-antitoxin module
MKIATNKQYHTALAEIEGLIEKGFGNLTEKETKQLEQLSLAVEAFEAVKYPMPIIPTIRTAHSYLNS